MRQLLYHEYVTKFYHKMRQVFYYKTRHFYHKIRQLSQNATNLLQIAMFITKFIRKRNL